MAGPSAEVPQIKHRDLPDTESFCHREYGGIDSSQWEVGVLSAYQLGHTL
ncbi:hypothetical protein OG225_39335 [Nocardia sp. NBC_01377]